jgi:hypothetical protein
MIEALVHPCAPLWLRDGQPHKQSMTPAEIGKGFLFESHKYSHRGCGGETT